MTIQHDALVKLVAQVNGILALISWPFVLYEVFTKHPAVAQLKEKIEQRRNELLGFVILDLVESLKPYLPQRTSIIVVEPAYGETQSENLSDAAIGEMKACLESNEKSLNKANRLRGMVPKILTLDRWVYRLIFCICLESLAALITWVFSQDMSTGIAIILLGVPTISAILTLMCAGARQRLIYSVQELLVDEED